MCDPTAGMWISMAMSAVQTYAQHETAQAQAEAIEVKQENEREEALSAAEEELGNRVREAREKRGRARVAAGESGAMGQSFAAAINQSIADQDDMAAKIAKGHMFADRAIQDRANSALAGINDPSALEAGLSIASSGMRGYSAGASMEASRRAAAEGTTTQQRRGSLGGFS